MKLKILIVPVLLVFIAAAVYFYLRHAEQKTEIAAHQSNPIQPAKDQSFDACSMITDDEIEAVQGEAVKTAKNNSRISGSLLISQCFYELNDYSKSVSFEITQTAPDAAEKADLGKIWEEKFNKPIPVDNDRDEEEKNEGKTTTEKTLDEKGANEPDSGGQPQAVSLGDAAFRVGNRITNALYVLKNNRIIRISIGGADDQNVKLEKLKKAARSALNRM